MDLFFFYRPITEHKNLEIQGNVGFYRPYFDLDVGFNLDTDGLIVNVSIFGIISFMIRFNRKADHAGFIIDFHTVFGFFMFQVYDCRHWDYDNDRWFIKGEDLTEYYKRKKATSS